MSSWWSTQFLCNQSKAQYGQCRGCRHYRITYGWRLRLGRKILGLWNKCKCWEVNARSGFLGIIDPRGWRSRSLVYRPLLSILMGSKCLRLACRKGSKGSWSSMVCRLSLAPGPSRLLGYLLHSLRWADRSSKTVLTNRLMLGLPHWVSDPVQSMQSLKTRSTHYSLLGFSPAWLPCALANPMMMAH